MLTMALVVPIIWLLKSIAYLGVFRLRTIRVTWLSCLIIAGAPFFAMIVPLPGVLAIAVAIGAAVYLTMHYTGVEFFPEGLLIPVAVEVVFMGVLWGLREAGVPV
jgi:hypothetical protein